MKSLTKAVKNYISLRRKLGFKMKGEEIALLNFASFLKQQRAIYITTKLALRWAVQPINAQPAHLATRLRMVRLFAEYWSATDPRTEIPSQDLLPYRPHRSTPYIYSNDEIVRLIKAAKGLKSPKGLRRWTHSTIFGLLAVTGMRVGECVRLNRDDVDLTHRLLTIRGSKFDKSRLVPIHPSTQKALRQYMCKRDRIFRRPKTPGFFVTETGMRLKQWGIRWMFVKLSHQIGLRGPSDTHGPRLHDFRHRFAVQTLLRWYRAGVDVEQRLPILSAFLGHRHVTDTYWYLTATPELLRLAARRLKHTKGGL